MMKVRQFASSLRRQHQTSLKGPVRLRMAPQMRVTVMRMHLSLQKWFPASRHGWIRDHLCTVCQQVARPSGTAWDFPLAKSEKRELLLLHVAAGEQIATEQAQDAERQIALVREQRRQRTSEGLRARRRRRKRKSLGRVTAWAAGA
mmetsp:Transcript_17203/g.30167  ORF Transcript_17203/g.30167 Transcript_17203/m.30167 type:complete len:146 (-) Transcript_17203:41-478(-)